MIVPDDALAALTRALRRARAVLALVAMLAIAAAASSPWLVQGEWIHLVAAAWATIAVLALIAAVTLKSAPLSVTVMPAAATRSSSVPAEAMRELETLRTVQQELLAAKQAAEAATMAKGEFLATMSHEIRTPLNGIIPLLDLMMSTPLQSDQREYLSTAHRSAHALLRIVDDILDFSKLEASKLELENVGVNLKELVDSVAMLMESSATAKGLRLTVAIDPSVRLAVRGDPVRLRQVLTNLVSNAIKFTERGSVTIQLGKRGESRTHYETVFAVRDTGIGMSAETAAKLFQPFTQADTSTTRLYGGTGLGLVICKRLVDLMGGKIGVRSEATRGSLFWFNVPLQKAVGDIRVRRDLNGTRALLLGSDEAFVRRSSGLLANLGVSHIHTTIAVDALTKLRSSATMGQRWGYEILLIDVESMRTSTAALVRNVLRDPGLDHMRIIVSGAEENTRELKDGNRVGALAANFDERELRGLLHQLLGVDDSPVGRAQPMLELDAFMSAGEATAATEIRQLSGHVLLVEDNPVNLQVARRLLGMLGIEVDSAEDGRIALDRLARARYDLVLMDCQMPVMDGYAATRARRELESERGMPRLPIIAMTANAMVGDRQKCLDSGMDDYLTKPLDRRLLEKTLAHWLPAGTAIARKAIAEVGVSAPMPPSLPVPTAVRPPAPALQADSSTVRVIDETVVRELIDVMGDEFTHLVDVYLEDAPRLIGALRDAAKNNDADQFGAHAHSLKSSSANLGATALAELARMAEHDTKVHADINLIDTASRIDAEFLRVAAALRAIGSASA